MNILKASTLAILIAGTSACTIVPGSNMNSLNSRWFDDTPESYSPASSNIEYIPINATLLSHLNSSALAKQFANLKLQEAISNYEYRIGAGDILSITVWEHPELTIPAGSFRGAEDGGSEVNADGTIFYPYAGELVVAGLTSKEVKSLLDKRLGTVIKKPQIDVRVASFKSKRVYISGSVMQPGIIPISSIPLTLVDAIEKLGGLTDSASWGNVTLTRNGSVKTISLRSIYEEGNWTENILLQNNDLVHIPRNDADKIFVLGEINRPQSINMSRNGTSLAEAIAESNGINESRADGRGIYVLRNTGITKDSEGLPVYKATIYHLNASSAVGFMLADKFPLKTRDIVYVSPAPITRWNRFLSQLLPSIAATNSVSEVQNK